MEKQQMSWITVWYFWQQGIYDFPFLEGYTGGIQSFSCLGCEWLIGWVKPQLLYALVSFHEPALSENNRQTLTVRLTHPFESLQMRNPSPISQINSKLFKICSTAHISFHKATQQPVSPHMSASARNHCIMQAYNEHPDKNSFI